MNDHLAPSLRSALADDFWTPDEPAPAAARSAAGPPAVQDGYGACSLRGCNCPSYTGQADLCGNCGHKYSDHW